ncbi:hypothetical protein ACJRO7_021190 [Eucalyptus globulus]|uniref:Uncharacterized protein n=1 Tax=Eucalyptus globulus TaxID=34317 RepID=A0ABD3KNH3_EUCGL
MAFNKVAILSLALALIFFSSTPGLSEGRKWKLEKNNFPSMSSTGEYEMMGEEDNNNRGLLQSRVVYPPAPALSVEAFMPASLSHSPGVGHPEHPLTSTDRKYEGMMPKEDNDDHDFPMQPHVVKSPALVPTEEAISHAGPDDSREDGGPIHPTETSPGHSPGVGHELPPQVAAFRPTSPGHSPGVGNELPPQVTAFRPTSPGHSPGAGHELPPQVAAFRPTSPGHSPGAGHELPPLAP